LLGAAHHEVEGGIITVRRLDRRVDHGRGLGQGRALGVRQGQGVTEDDLALVRPDLEMAQPGALIDHRHQFIGRRAPRLGHPQVQRQAQLKAVPLGPPGEPQLIVLPVAGQGEGQIALVRAVERQVLRRQDVFDHIQRIKGQVDLFGSHSIHQAFNFFSNDGDSDERL
uniref:ABC transporter ATP-binding protein n=1 Tax=Parastrongyloides trichosuri TaxID=131310 RepID=A0A0N4ZKZ3_PARTI